MEHFVEIIIDFWLLSVFAKRSIQTFDRVLNASLNVLCVISTSFNRLNRINNYMCKVNNRNTRTRLEICSKLTIKRLKRRHCCRSGVFIVNFEYISHPVSDLLLLTLSNKVRCYTDINFVMENSRKTNRSNYSVKLEDENHLKDYSRER